MHFKNNPIGTNPVYLVVANQLNADRDVALREYIPYYDKLEFSIPSGYNTPSNIAQDLTSQMHKSDAIETITKHIPNEAQNGTTEEINLSVSITSPTFKKFNCACVYNYNRTTYDDNIGTEVNTNDKYYSVKRYLEAYNLVVFQSFIMCIYNIYKYYECKRSSTH
eukprot:SAG11_NODE_883_length_6737_cov_10.576981_5_plen_165_part_00